MECTSAKQRHCVSALKVVRDGVGGEVWQLAEWVKFGLNWACVWVVSQLWQLSSMANRILQYVVSQREAIDEGNSSVHA